MTVLRIEHPVRSFEAWKAAFDSDPAGRLRGGVRRYQVYRAVDDPAYVAIDLDFADRSVAESFLGGLERMWRTRAAGMLGGAPRTRIVDIVEDHAY
jgi:hypothetical protein